ncbi:MAG: hypothetical protein WCK77_19785, partial [Verrucomicrobiota bacterium]
PINQHYFSSNILTEKNPPLPEVGRNEEASPFKTGSDPEVFRGKKSGGTGFFISLARRALAVNQENVSEVLD